jgi:hypothetical protein
MSLFFVVTISVSVTRLVLYLFPVSSPTILGFRIHHYMYGILAVALGLASRNLLVYSVGIGLSIDEATYLLMRGKSHRDNYSAISLIGTGVLLVVTFLARNALASFVR